ncbi:MAG: cytochrome c [Halioglobus sp.]|nr:cytochrome c [Halioglobus sp.]
MMSRKMLAAIITVCSLAAIPNPIYAEEHEGKNQGIELSPGLLELLREEMREIAAGIQTVPLSLVSANWQSIVETSTKIQASYIMERKLTEAQVNELKQALPEHFKQLDAEFHQRAVRLGAAASAHDAELVSFEYSRLIETCATCHAAYANLRFPGF